MAFQRYLGIGKETVFGTEATAITMKYIDAESAEIEASGDSIIIYEGMSGLDSSMAAGRYGLEGSVAFPVDETSIGIFARGVLGGYAKTGTAPMISHSFVPDRSKMDTYTMAVGKDQMEQIYMGVAFSGMTLELEDGLLTASVDLVGQKDKKGTGTPSKALSDLVKGAIFAAKDVNVTIGGTDESGKIQSMSVTIENGTEPFFGFGSRFPSKHIKGAFLVEAEFTMAFEDTAQLERFWGGATGPTNTTPAAFAVNIAVGANLDIILPRAIYTAVSQPAAGRDRIEQTVSVRGLVDAVSGTGPIEIVLVNAETTY
jgi:hypothetical protein